jgi:hypothetical protein
MIASPNFVYGILDGDNSTGTNTVPPPSGSGALEKLFQDDFDSKKLPWETLGLSSGSDYDPFLRARIPAGEPNGRRRTFDVADD